MVSQLNKINSTSQSNDRLPKSASINPYVFLVGCPRSGTTMLKRMVSAHPTVAITRETHWIPKIFEKRYGMDDAGKVTPRIVEKLFEHHRFDQMKFRAEKLTKLIENNPGMSYSELVSRIFENYGRRKNKPLVGDKTPSYVRSLPTLVQLWPKARFVHLIRDGRDVCLSMRKWRMASKAAGSFSTFQSEPVVTTALWWKALVGLGREDGMPISEKRYYELSYESLVTQPGEECRRLAHFLDLPYYQSMEKYYEGRTQAEAGLSTNAAWLPPTPGRRNWRDQMEAADVAQFEAAAGDLLEMLGYERASSGISARNQQLVAKVREQFQQEAAQRNWRLPKLW